jgi:hypothetical protein
MTGRTQNSRQGNAPDEVIEFSEYIIKEFPGVAGVITQHQLAHLQELQSALASYERGTKKIRHALRKLHGAIRKEMLGGTIVEDGPIRAWIDNGKRLVVK